MADHEPGSRSTHGDKLGFDHNEIGEVASYGGATGAAGTFSGEFPTRGAPFG